MKLIGAFRKKLLCTSFVIIFSQYGRHRPFCFPIFAEIDRVLPLYLINSCVKYEFDTSIGVAGTRHTSSWRVAETASRPKTQYPRNFGDIETLLRYVCTLMLETTPINIPNNILFCHNEHIGRFLFIDHIYGLCYIVT